MNRLAWIDNLRVMVIILVVILHTAVTYSGLGGWYYQENQEVDMFSTLFFAFYLTFTQAYFMSLLFMVSGYFTQRSLEKKGITRFVSGRLKRLGIPLLIYIFLIHPVAVKLAYPEVDINWYLNGITRFDFISWTGPLWFVEALLIFSLIYVFIYKFISNSSLKIKFKFSIYNVVLLILTITVIAFLARLFYPIGTNFYNLQFGFFSAYIFMFGTGIIAYKTNLFDQISLKAGIRWLILSLGLGIPAWFFIIFFGGTLEGNMLIEGGMNWPAFFYALWESFFCVTFILALVGIFKYKVNISSKFQKLLSDNAFGVFVFHAPVLIGISMILKEIEIYPVLKFLLVFAIAVPATFFVAWLVRKIGFLRKIFS